MSEQVINIRDRIEKMRTQMTGPNEAVARNKDNLEIKSDHLSEDKNNKEKVKTPATKRIENNQVKDQINVEEKIIKVEKTEIEEGLKRKVDDSKNFHRSNFQSKYKSTSSNKTYKDYHNDNIYDENKKSVKLDEDQAFPQFNLNVSNPISWKLMLLIMLMQLLTNIMLVIVLYLK